MRMVAGMAALAAAWAVALAAEAGDRVLCSTETIHECAPGSGCIAVRHADADVPHIIAVDLAGRRARGFLPAGERVSVIQDVIEVDGGVIARGLDEGSGGGDSTRSWVATLTRDGDLAISAVGNGAALVVLGSCIAMERIAGPD